MICTDMTMVNMSRGHLHLLYRQIVVRLHADATFYVLSSDNNVYKVIDNNGNSASTVEPTGTSTSILTTGDSYKWKYMYTLTASEQTNFLSTDFMHVSTDSTVSSAAVDGAIDTILIKTAGSGGANGTHTGVAIRGDGSSGECSVTVSGGAITAVTVTTGGSGYTFAYVRNADIVSGCNKFIRCRIRCNHSAKRWSWGKCSRRIRWAFCNDEHRLYR